MALLARRGEPLSIPTVSQVSGRICATCRTVSCITVSDMRQRFHTWMPDSGLQRTRPPWLVCGLRLSRVDQGHLGSEAVGDMLRPAVVHKSLHRTHLIPCVPPERGIWLVRVVRRVGITGRNPHTWRVPGQASRLACQCPASAGGGKSNSLAPTVCVVAPVAPSAAARRSYTSRNTQNTCRGCSPSLAPLPATACKGLSL